jgi:hypothetical protein
LKFLKQYAGDVCCFGSRKSDEDTLSLQTYGAVLVSLLFHFSAPSCFLPLVSFYIMPWFSPGVSDLYFLEVIQELEHFNIKINEWGILVGIPILNLDS